MLFPPLLIMLVGLCCYVFKICDGNEDMKVHFYDFSICVPNVVDSCKYSAGYFDHRSVSGKLTPYIA